MPKRLQNTPKKYPNKKGTIRPRKLCPNCELRGIKRYLKNTKTHFNINGSQKTIMPLSFCKHCRYIEWNEEAIQEIPD